MSKANHKSGSRQRKLRHFRLQFLAEHPFCFYCGFELHVQNSTIDHVVPLASNGLDAPENLVLCCQRCNNRKADRPFHTITCSLRRGEGALTLSQFRSYYDDESSRL